MSSEQAGKRKSPPLGPAQQFKRKKGGNDNKWKTSHQTRGKPQNFQKGTVEPGDVGIWVTCARGMEGRAARELQILFDEYAEEMYSILPAEAAAAEAKESDGEPDDDIEAVVKREIAALKQQSAGGSKTPRTFVPIRLNVECLLFTKTQSPIEPVELAHRICQDAKEAAMAHAAGSTGAEVGMQTFRKCRYLNRLTPITASAKANEKGIEEVAEQVLLPWFNMKATSSSEGDQPEEKPGHSFAIRVTSRHHATLKRDDVIRQIATLIDGRRHKVDLEKPDKVILVNIFKTTVGMSVVGGDWEDLKRYNISEIYSIPLSSKAPEPQAENNAVEAKAESNAAEAKSVTEEKAEETNEKAGGTSEETATVQQSEQSEQS